MKNETNAKSDKKSAKSTVEGEGSYTATHNYNEGVAKSVAAGKSEELAKKAKMALEGSEGPELEAAAEKAKSRAK